MPVSIAGALHRRAVAHACAAIVSWSACGMGVPLQVVAAETASCNDACFRECDAIAPGNQGYCKSQCDTYCESQGPTGEADVLRTDVTAVPGGKDCSTYKTAKAQNYCMEQKSVVAEKSSMSMNNGIFGDSGVTYSKGVEDLFATAFGATRQNKPVNQADVGAFASDIGDAAKTAILGK